jgi:hypothetical protein
MATEVGYGYDLDTSFLQKPHHADPRRVYSTTSTDWQQRVDFERMRRERLARAKAQLVEKDLGAVVLFTGESRCCSRPSAPTSSAPRSTCRGWRTGSGRR